MAQAAAAAQRILSFRVRDNGNNKAGLELQEVTGGVEIELKDVWFKYPTRDVPIFTGLSIKIERGQFAALVGASGMVAHREPYLQFTDYRLRLWKNQHSFPC